MNKNKPSKSNQYGGLLLFGGLLAVCLAGLCFGSTPMRLDTLWAGVCGEDATARVILQYIRLPRVLGGVLAGVGLAVSGSLLQRVTNNDLAGPNIIGVNAGAGLAAILTLFAAPALAAILPLTAFCGALLTTLLIAGIAAKAGGSRSTVVLAGVAVTALLNAAISLISLLDPDVLVSYNHFSIGGLAGVQAESLWLPAAIIAAALAAALLLAKRLDLLMLGDSMASALGARVRPLRFVALLLASASAAAAVSFAGLLGFVGLVVPHIARRMAGGGLRRQLCFSALLGGILVVLADLLGRVLIAPSEIPVGILMAAIGAPFFFWLLVRRRVERAI
ncbi:MAG: iron ABC transporter permease [Clostridia bacterium]|nr:iron ABC transporter permease [Clostridia bacterium]